MLRVTSIIVFPGDFEIALQPGATAPNGQRVALVNMRNIDMRLLLVCELGSDETLFSDGDTAARRLDRALGLPDTTFNGHSTSAQPHRLREMDFANMSPQNLKTVLRSVKSASVSRGMSEWVQFKEGATIQDLQADLGDLIAELTVKQSSPRGPTNARLDQVQTSWAQGRTEDTLAGNHNDPARGALHRVLKASHAEIGVSHDLLRRALIDQAETKRTVGQLKLQHELQSQGHGHDGIGTGRETGSVWQESVVRGRRLQETSVDNNKTWVSVSIMPDYLRAQAMDALQVRRRAGGAEARAGVVVLVVVSVDMLWRLRTTSSMSSHDTLSCIPGLYVVCPMRCTCPHRWSYHTIRSMCRLLVGIHGCYVCWPSTTTKHTVTSPAATLSPFRDRSGQT